ncbi:hypothetical protein E2C01_035728 [Portunus trituberculatus]|uniref:Uncharacterized protein n=1 Tax=Portunus trituberculatus TaxID=210409 RepID=A0A5B7FC88_PORTR|nr:hypothetical protein [Portunus trituberculatus]
MAYLPAPSCYAYPPGLPSTSNPPPDMANTVTMRWLKAATAIVIAIGVSDFPADMAITTTPTQRGNSTPFLNFSYLKPCDSSSNPVTP